MFGAIGKIFRTLGYLLTGRANRISGIWAKNPDVIAATFDHVVNSKRTSLNQYKDAVGGMIAQEEKKKITLKALTEETEKLERLRQGALAKGKQAAAKYATNPEGAKVDPDIIKCQTAFRDFSTTLAEKQARITELETDIKQLSTNIAGHKSSIETLLRELDKLKAEKHETIADVVSAEEEKKIADMFSGISQDKTANELAELRDMRTKAKADARMSRELAGMETKKSEDEFLEYANASTHDDEFSRLLGLTKETPAATTVATETKLSET